MHGFALRLLAPRRTRVIHLARYASVSAVSTTVSLAVLGLLVGPGTVTAGWANLIATGVGTVPSFELNRRWVWAKRDRSSMTGEVLPFCALSFLALGLSTLAVHFAASWADQAGWSALGRTVAVEGASVSSFGSLWVAQYMILDRWLFRRRSTADRPSAAATTESRAAATAADRPSAPATTESRAA